MEQNFKRQLADFLSSTADADRDQLVDDCVSNEEILLYARRMLNILPDATRARVTSHLAEGRCARCTELADLVRAAETDYETRKARFLTSALGKQNERQTPFRDAFESFWLSLKFRRIWILSSAVLMLILWLGIPAGKLFLESQISNGGLITVADIEALRGGKIPKNPIDLQHKIDEQKKTAIAGDGEILSPDEVQLVRVSIQESATYALQELKNEWVVSDNKSAELGVLSNYIVLTGSSSNIPDITELEIQSISLEQGTLVIITTSSKIESETVQSFFKKSAKFTPGINNLRIRTSGGFVKTFPIE